MKKTLIGILITMMAFGVGNAFAGNDSPDAKKLYSLNIIGVPGDKYADMDDNNGHRIFVPIDDKTKILLIEGADFAVLDANGTDGEAEFQMPNPGLDPYVIGDENGADTDSDYSVYVRPLGKPGGWATITTCAQLVESNFTQLLPKTFVRTLNRQCEWDSALASIEQVGQEITMRDRGPSKFQNVTAELLTIVFEVEVDTDGDLATVDDTEIIYVRVPIFDDSIENEYWEYDNHGLKLLQVRFYDNETDVSENDGAYLE